MVNVREATHDCGVLVSWSLEPTKSGESPTSQKVSIKSKSGAFLSAGLEECGEDTSEHTCTVPSSVLVAAPYNLRAGDAVVARVAVAYRGGTVSVPPNREGARLMMEPARMPAPTVTSNPDDSLNISWAGVLKASKGDKLKGATKTEQSYELAWDQGAGFINTVDARLKITSETSYTTEALHPGKAYRFVVRSQNACGYGQYSPVKRFALNQRPAAMAPVLASVNLASCSLDISWTKPTAGTKVSEYKVYAEGSSGFKEVCASATPEGLSCTVPLNTLAGPAFGLKVGDRLQLSASAKNEIGWSQRSEPSASAPDMATAPQQMVQPKLISKNGDSITITWGTLNHPYHGGFDIQAFLVEWDDGVNEVKTKDVSVDQQTATIRGVVAGRQYSIRVKAKNSCGFGGYSEPLVVAAAGCPQQAKNAPDVGTKGKDVVITWDEAVVEAGHPVTRYQLLLRNKDGSFSEHKDYCDGSSAAVMEERTCYIPMARVPELTGLGKQDIIQAKVAAINRLCQGPFSPMNLAGQRIGSCPAKMQRPYTSEREVTTTEIKLNWARAEASADQRITEYEVQWQSCVTTTWERANTAKTSSLYFNHAVQNGECLRYIVRAYNKYCSGDWSDFVEITSGSVPPSMPPPVVEIVPKRSPANGEPTDDVRISWGVGDVQGAVQGYGVYFGTSSGEYLEDKELCDGQSEAVILTRECRVPMSAFWSGPFRKDQGTLISVKVRAINSKGPGELSPWNNEGATIEKVPFAMNKPDGTRQAEKNAIELSWDEMRYPLDGGSPITTYNLQFKFKQDKEWMNVVGLTSTYLDTSFYHDGHATDSVLEYRIRAANKWGWGKFSTPNLVIETAKAPEKIPSAETSIEPQTGALKVEWEVPDDNGSEIHNYNLQVKNAVGEWKETEDCRDKKSMMRSTQVNKDVIVCLVKMTTLREEFGLAYGQLVEIQVRAVNFAGRGTWSRPNVDGVTVKREPARMASPVRGMGTDSRKIAVAWDAQKTIEQRGDSVILGYILQDDAEILYQGTDTEYTFEAQTGLIYNLRIAARNIYGRGEFSEPLKIRAGAAPAVVDAISSTNIEENKIQISW